MCSMASSPFSTSESVLNSIQYEQSSISTDDCNDGTMPVITDVRSIDKPRSRRRIRPVRTSLVAYGPIRIRKRQTSAPTLATGRRSKDAIVEGEDNKKRELRRMQNRESARNLKKLRDNIEKQLQSQVNQLENEGNNLSTHVNNLQTYKQYLEEQCRQIYPIYQIIARTAAAILLEYKKQQTSETSIEPKEEPRSPSPSHWQSSFRI